MPNWQGSNRRDTLPPNWSATQLRILNRDHHRCQHLRTDNGLRCLANARAVDHIINHADGGTDDDSNLEALCDWHHNQKSGREGGRASGKARRATRDAAKPAHPGMTQPTAKPPEDDIPPF